MKRIAAVLLVALSAAAQQTTPPPPAAPREVTLPRPVEKTLANGLRVVVVPKHETPLVAAQLMVKAGAAADPAGRDGLAQLTAAVLTKGTKSRTAEELARGVEALGATLQSEAWWDSSTVSLSVMSTNFGKAMEYVADVTRHATFGKDEIDLERAQTIDELQVVLGQPRDVASLVAARLLFGAGPYGHSAAGTPASLEKIGRDDLVSFHAAHYRPGNSVLVVAGDVKPQEVFALAERHFGSWKGTSKPSKAAGAPVPSKGRRVVIVDMPEAGQSAVVVARPGIRRGDPAYYRAMVANSVLGGGYSSRLNQEIRIRRGLSYGAGSSFQARASVGPFMARTETKNESAAEVVRLILAQMDGLAKEEVPESELVPRKAVLIGDFAQSLETTGGLVDRISGLALHGLPLDDINRYIGGVQAVSAGQVKSFSASSLRVDDATIVVAGDSSRFADAMVAQYGSVEIIPIADLDLGSPTLRVRKAKQ